LSFWCTAEISWCWIYSGETRRVRSKEAWNSSLAYRCQESM
jgi:hypothetical protein